MSVWFRISPNSVADGKDGDCEPGDVPTGCEEEPILGALLVAQKRP